MPFDNLAGKKCSKFGLFSNLSREQDRDLQGFCGKDVDCLNTQFAIFSLQRHITSLWAIWDPQGKMLFHFLHVVQLAVVKRLS